VGILKLVCTFVLAGGVAIGLGDGDEFDDAGCSTAQKPVPACQRVQFAKSAGFGVGRTPAAGIGPAMGDDGGQDEDRPREVPDCVYRLPDGMCRIRELQCKLLPGRWGDSTLTPDVVMRMFRQLDGKLDVWLAGTKQLWKVNEALRRENAALAKMQADGLLTFVQKIDAESFQQGVTVLIHGDVAKAARALGLSDSTLRSKIARWPKQGKAYAALAEVVRWRKAIKGEAGAEIAKRVASGVEREVDYPALLRDVIEELGMLDPENWEERTASLAEALRKAVG
jgi:hypothetical protein